MQPKKEKLIFGNRQMKFDNIICKKFDNRPEGLEEELQREMSIQQ
jgi:hypothetical protein